MAECLGIKVKVCHYPGASFFRKVFHFIQLAAIDVLDPGDIELRLLRGNMQKRPRRGQGSVEKSFLQQKIVVEKKLSEVRPLTGTDLRDQYLASVGDDSLSWIILGGKLQCEPARYPIGKQVPHAIEIRLPPNAILDMGVTGGRDRLEFFQRRSRRDGFEVLRHQLFRLEFVVLRAGGPGDGEQSHHEYRERSSHCGLRQHGCLLRGMQGIYTNTNQLCAVNASLRNLLKASVASADKVHCIRSKILGVARFPMKRIDSPAASQRNRGSFNLLASRI